MSQRPPVPPSLVFDDLILNSPHGTVLVPICAKEVLVLRTIGTRWQKVVKAVTEAHTELMVLPEGYGDTDFKLYVTRKFRNGSVIQTAGHEINLPQDLFEWPL